MDADQTGRRRGLPGWLTRHQARLFFPLLLLEGLNLKVNGIVDLRNRTRRERLVEGSLMALHFAAYASLLLIAMSPAKALVFLLVHHALVGLHLGAAFAPNHKGMPMPEPGVPWDHLRRQVLTSRNVRGGPVTDWMLGGLNYQIEHHLVPSMPRGNLRKAQPIVRAHCARLGVAYAETGLIESYRQALRHMHAVGAPCAPPAATGCTRSRSRRPATRRAESLHQSAEPGVTPRCRISTVGVLWTPRWLTSVAWLRANCSTSEAGSRSSRVPAAESGAGWPPGCSPRVPRSN